jgi:hypothetical protein
MISYVPFDTTAFNRIEVEVMRDMLLFALILALFVPACDMGGGSFCATGTESVGSTTYVGCLSTVKGRAVQNGHAIGERQSLLYLMIICPDVTAAANQGSGGGVEGNPMIKPKIYYEWQTTNGPVRVSFEWDTRKDRILVGGQEFMRPNGNVFVIERQPNGKLFAQQCGTLGSNASLGDVAYEIRRKLPGDHFVSSAKFRSIDD